MYINSKKRSRDLKYLFLVLCMLSIFDLFLKITDDFMPLKSMYLMSLFVIFIVVRGPFALEYDRTGKKLKILNQSAIFGSLLPFSSSFIEVQTENIRGYKINENFIRPNVWVQYVNQSGKIEERTFCLWSLSKPERKDIKASLGRILTANRQTEKLAIIS
jgi:hypothetical protein